MMSGESESTTPNRTTSMNSWRTAFLTLRDETTSGPPSARILPMLDELVFSHFQTLVAAAPLLPPHEVTSDLLFLLNLAASSSCCCQSDGSERALSLICHLVHIVALRVPLELNSSVWADMLGCFGNLAKFFFESGGGRRLLSDNSVGLKAVSNCLENTRHLMSVDVQRSSVSDNILLVKFLLDSIIRCPELYGYSHSRHDSSCSGDSGKRFPQQTGLWRLQTTAFSMVGDSFARVGSSFPLEIWQSAVEALRTVMDSLANKTFLVEDGILSRFYTSVLHCLHTVLINRKGSISDHLAAFIAALKMFISYGLNKSSLLPCRSDRDAGPSSHMTNSRETTKKVGTYRPPHLRRKKSSCPEQTQTQISLTSSGYDSSPAEYSSSDSDYSDSDAVLRDSYSMQSCKSRVAAMICIQDLCEADPKAFVAQWALLLPTNDALQPRKHEATLLTCLLNDPFMKVRLAAASTIAAMLEGPSSTALQVAEYKESNKCGSYMALSSSLGRILMQLHSGVLHLIQHEKHTGMLTSLFKILMLLISSTPYSRMPGDLLPRVLSSLKLRIEAGFPFMNDQTSFMVISISCLTAAVSTTPTSVNVNEMLQAETSTGLYLGRGGAGVVITLFQHAEKVKNPTICLEALQALKALCHYYPNVMAACWKDIFVLVSKFLRPDAYGSPSRKGAVGNDVGSTDEKVVSAAIKVLDECLRAASGFKGTEDLFGDKLMETPYASEFVRDKKISSAPSYGSDVRQKSEDNLSGITEWSEALEKHIAVSIRHASGMVRASSVTCFAGITSTVFFSLEKQQQQLVLSSCIGAANDSVPLVRSAACRAVGVIACFSEILKSAEILRKFIKAVEVNTRDQPVSVRITASWAMANICDSFGHCLSDSSLDLRANIQLLMFLLECSLQLVRDGDKIKSNAVRALGNISRVVPFHNPVKHGNCSVTCSGTSKECPSKCSIMDYNSSHSSDILGCSHLLEKIVQAFLSCITTGNVKVQWNVCHALSNLFLNESLRTQPMDWASPIFSILLLLLRDSPNFKIRIQAAAALAVPTTVLNYGSSFTDVVKGIENILEDVTTDQTSTSSFKYRMALEKQLTATMLHVICLCSSSSHELLKEFLLKKASFFESWLNDLWSSLEMSTHQGNEADSQKKQKRDLLSKAVQSLVEVFESRNQFASAQKFQKVLAASR